MSTVKKKSKSTQVVIPYKKNEQMSPTTMDFIQKICYKQAMTIDMTKYGFISDSKLQPINLLLKPLKTQLEKIIVDKTKPPMPILKQSSEKKRSENLAVKFNIKDHSNQPSIHSTQNMRKQSSIKTIKNNVANI